MAVQNLSKHSMCDQAASRLTTHTSTLCCDIKRSFAY
jgi:hypothetical protein